MEARMRTGGMETSEDTVAETTNTERGSGRLGFFEAAIVCEPSVSKGLFQERNDR
jgi:hypothetical protein